MTNKGSGIFITSHNQSGGITAHTVNIGSPPRQLDPASAVQLEQNIPKDKPVKVTAVMGDQEAFAFASQITSYLKSKGYSVDGVNQAIYSQPVIGQFINPSAGGYDIVIGGKQT